jgi:hypothetical protein
MGQAVVLALNLLEAEVDAWAKEAGSTSSGTTAGAGAEEGAGKLAAAAKRLKMPRLEVVVVGSAIGWAPPDSVRARIEVSVRTSASQRGNRSVEQPAVADGEGGAEEHEEIHDEQYEGDRGEGDREAHEEIQEDKLCTLSYNHLLHVSLALLRQTLYTIVQPLIASFIGSFNQ